MSVLLSKISVVSLSIHMNENGIGISIPLRFCVIFVILFTDFVNISGSEGNNRRG